MLVDFQMMERKDGLFQLPFLASLMFARIILPFCARSEKDTPEKDDEIRSHDFQR
jgi:hypothetical protein